jgi:hypothetical protein
MGNDYPDKTVQCQGQNRRSLARLVGRANCCGAGLLGYLVFKGAAEAASEQGGGLGSSNQVPLVLVGRVQGYVGDPYEGAGFSSL